MKINNKKNIFQVSISAENVRWIPLILQTLKPNGSQYLDIDKSIFKELYNIQYVNTFFAHIYRL